MRINNNGHEYILTRYFLRDTRCAQAVSRKDLANFFQYQRPWVKAIFGKGKNQRVERETWPVRMLNHEDYAPQCLAVGCVRFNEVLTNVIREWALKGPRKKPLKRSKSKR